jgi:hypothetical protein
LKTYIPDSCLPKCAACGFVWDSCDEEPHDYLGRGNPVACSGEERLPTLVDLTFSNKGGLRVALLHPSAGRPGLRRSIFQRR